MNIRLDHGHKLVDARGSYDGRVTIVTTHNQTVVLSRSDVLTLLKAIDREDAEIAASVAAARLGSPSGTGPK